MLRFATRCCVFSRGAKRNIVTTTEYAVMSAGETSGGDPPGARGSADLHARFEREVLPLRESLYLHALRMTSNHAMPRIWSRTPS
jgi:hypothetical protein